MKRVARRQRICLAAGIVSFLLFFACQPALAVAPKRVLLIYNSVGYQELVARNIRTELQQRSPEPLEIYSAPFAAASAADEAVTIRYADYLGALLQGQRLDLALTVGSPATNFFRQYGRQLFPSAPMLAILEESRVPSNLETNEIVATGSLDLVGAVENILRLLPQTTNVLVVIGNSPLEQYWQARQRAAFQAYAGRVSFSWLNDLSFEEILRHSATLSSGSAILFNSLFGDALGVAYDDHEVVSRLHAVAKAPIFTFDDSDFGQGIVGGHGPSTEEVSRDYASVALRILRGDVLGGAVIPGAGTGQPKFDWREMQRWGIDESRLPPESTIYYRDPTAWQRYRWQIMTTAAALLVQTLLILGLFYERHRRRHAEATSRQHMSELAHMSRIAVAGELSASIAHEVKQPLAAIAASGSAGLRWLARATPDLVNARASFERVVKAAQHAGDVIDTIRSMFKKSDGERLALDPNTLIEDVLTVLRGDLRRRGISVEAHLRAGLPQIVGNRVQLQQVVLNLIVNAAEAMDSVTDRARVLKLTSDQQERSSVLIIVEDTGPGMEPKNIERIFEPFYTTKPDGMGMGLAICRSIVESHGGHMSAVLGRSGGLAMQISMPVSAMVTAPKVA